MTTMTPTRRDWLRQHAAALLALTAGAASSGCASPGSEHANAEPAGDDRIVDSATGRTLTVDELLRRMRQADVVLLGELHDNPHHHARRAELLLGLGGAAPVVAEQLPHGDAFTLPATARGDALRDALQAAGFEADAWGWPRYEPLFAAVARSGARLRGGNLDLEAVRRAAREGATALPADLTRRIDAAPLTPAALSALNDDLQRGHCGQLPTRALPGMVAAQRARDASMAATLLAEVDQLRATGRQGPVLLLAGNGHVRRDYGVPTLLTQRQPALKLLSIGFAESGGADASYDVTWITPPAQREDPCKGFTLPPRSS